MTAAPDPDPRPPAALAEVAGVGVGVRLARAGEVVTVLAEVPASAEALPSTTR